MKQIFHRSGFLFFLLFLTLPMLTGTSWIQADQQAQTSRVEDGISSLLETERNKFDVAGEALYYLPSIRAFYADRANQRPVWVQGDKLTKNAKSLIQFLSQSDEEGLQPMDYHLATIKTLSESSPGIEIELLLTDAFFIYGSHLNLGRFLPKKTVYWRSTPASWDGVATLKQALEGDFESNLKNLAPSLPAYQRLKQVLKAYRDLEKSGGWPLISSGPKLIKGDQGPRVKELAERLRATGELKSNPSENFDDSLEESLKNFQQHQGLEVDGALGGETLVALNKTVTDRIRQIETNLDRLRWLPRDLGNPHVFVNIADFQLSVMEDNKPILKTNVVTGLRRQWQTPFVSSEISSLIFNPKWNVPENIFRKEVIRHLRDEPDYLQKENMMVVGKEGVVDSSTINWAEVDPKNWEYRLVQREGRGNALGKVKFMFTNPFSIYLHDTPQKKFFQRRVRAFSHGCVRVENPMTLVEYLLKNDPQWDIKKINTELDSGKNQSIALPKAVPVHVFYLTVWVDENGEIQFRDDVYGKDTLNTAKAR